MDLVGDLDRNLSVDPDTRKRRGGESSLQEKFTSQRTASADSVCGL